MCGKLGRYMNFETLKILGYQVQHSQILDNDSVDTGICQFIQNAEKSRNFTVSYQYIQGKENLAIVFVSKM